MTMASQICKQEEIVYWLMEYSHFYGYNDMDDLWKSYQQPVVYKIAAALEAMVTSPHLESFDLAVTLIEHVFTVDPHVCPFKVYSKLLLGIKKKLMVQELHKGHLNVHKLLNFHFPHEGLSYPNQCYKDHAEMKRTVDRYRAFFIPLIYSQYKRWQYFATDYEADFGAGFMNELRGLLTIFLQKLRERLPMPVLEMLLRNQGNIPKSTCPCGHVELLLQYSRGKHRFSVHEIRTIFDEITSLHQCKLQDGEEDPGFLCSVYSHPGCHSIGEGYIHRYSNTSASDIFVLSDSDVGSIVPPSTGDSDINVELDNLADDVEFEDHMCGDTLPDLSRFLHPQSMSHVQ